MKQLVLPISLSDTQTFASFYIGENALFIDYLTGMLTKSGFSSLYFWAGYSSGRTHLLHSACQHLSLANKLISYIPLDQYLLLTPSILSGLDDYNLVCLDNINHIAGNKIWEEAIFNFFNRLKEKGQSKLLVTSNAAPKHTPFSLPDLVSRLEWGQVYQLKPLNDEDKLKALQLRAKLRGFELRADVGIFLLKRVDRDMKALFNLLDQLDKLTMSAGRKLTIPFIKAVFNL